MMVPCPQQGKLKLKFCLSGIFWDSGCFFLVQGLLFCLVVALHFLFCFKFNTLSYYFQNLVPTMSLQIANKSSISSLVAFSVCSCLQTAKAILLFVLKCLVQSNLVVLSPKNNFCLFNNSLGEWISSHLSMPLSHSASS